MVFGRKKGKNEQQSQQLELSTVASEVEKMRELARKHLQEARDRLAEANAHLERAEYYIRTYLRGCAELEASLERGKKIRDNLNEIIGRLDALVTAIITGKLPVDKLIYMCNYFTLKDFEVIAALLDEIRVEVVRRAALEVIRKHESEVAKLFTSEGVR